MKQEIENKYGSFDKEISENISKIMAENLDPATPLMKLFRDQQQKLFIRQKTALCYHDNQNQQNQPQLMMDLGTQIVLFYPVGED